MRLRQAPVKPWPSLLPLLPDLLPLRSPRVLSMQPTYCGLCDIWFSSQRSFDAHLVLNEKHPSCDKCDRKFADRLAYLKVVYYPSPLHVCLNPKRRNRQHLILSPKHHYCSHCGTDHNSALELRAVRLRAFLLALASISSNFRMLTC